MNTAKSRARPADPAPRPDDWHDPLAQAFRRFGHLAAAVDPLGRQATELHPDLAELSEDADPRELERWRRAYCGSIGAEYLHITDRERACWLAARLEDPAPEVPDRARVIHRLMEAELFERFLHKRYVGAKRYSLEGAAGLVLLLDGLLDTAAEGTAKVALLGMSHRGRLTVMASTVHVEADALFAGLEDVNPRSILGSGDVKYHLGATGVHRHPGGHELRVHLVSNPSHLEAVNPVLMGRARARQTRIGELGRGQVVPICLHGDAAFAGQGITSETLNMADLEGYSVGGTVHVIVNNRIGFTAEPESLHSSRNSSDAAKRIEIPILHVNGEDPSAIARVARIALEYRQRYGSDVLIDLIAYRRYGHSEVEDPTTTSPRLYAGIGNRSMLFEQFADEWNVDAEWIARARRDIESGFSDAHDRGSARTERPVLRKLPPYWDDYLGGQWDPDRELETGILPEALDAVTAAIESRPDGFSAHPKVARMLDQRVAMLRGDAPLDFGAAEAAAIGSLLAEGRRVRISGQDSRRGTFNHRNAVIHDIDTGADYNSLDALGPQPGRFEVHDSPLSEAAVLGFEYGFSRDWPDGLIAWEAQFGDFANGAQIVIDQFLAAAEDKWQLLSGLVLLLPHGYEGQGPEHSSARIERFLQLASEHNLQICQPSTAAQYFHLLRRQVLGRWRKPLVVFTPKGLLRARPAASQREELVSGSFRRLIGDPSVTEAQRILLCTGKIAHELRAERDRLGSETAILCVEQLYPFPDAEVHAELQRLRTARKVVWVQEEPANMGPLAYVRPQLLRLAGGRHVTSVKRSASASPATGSIKAHRLEQEALIRLAFA